MDERPDYPADEREDTQFEVLTSDGLRWRVMAKDEAELDGFIDRGVVTAASVRSFGKQDWRVNCKSITAYRPDPKE